jgi:hypothetical protein
MWQSHSMILSLLLTTAASPLLLRENVAKAGSQRGVRLAGVRLLAVVVVVDGRPGRRERIAAAARRQQHVVRRAHGRGPGRGQGRRVGLPR